MKSRKPVFAAFATALALTVAAPALATETLTAVFTQPDGGVSTGLYSGTVKIRVSGTGQSLGQQFNDAFYLINSQTHDGSYYQLTFGTAALTAFNPAQNAVNYIVGGLPAYNPSHVYSFLLNTGLSTPGQLHFGVGDGQFNDNSGAFTIQISAVPEPAAWAMMVGGFGLLGVAMRRRPARNIVTA